MVQETAKIACLCGIFRQGRTQPESVDRTYKEGVAGSNSASPTYKSPANSGISRTRRKGREVLPGPLYTNGTPMRLVGKRILYGGERVLHGACGVVS